MDVRVANAENGRIELIPLPAELLTVLVALPEQMERYFCADPNARSIPIGQIVLNHVRTDGIKSANYLMQKAYNNLGELRKSILVREVNGYYLVIDGNSTVINGIFSGWKFIQAIIFI